MSFLENRIPPPLIMLITLIFMAIVSRFDYERALQLTPSAVNNYLGITLVFLGFLVAVLGIREFKRVETTINPMQPEKASSLVRSGVFRFTRNPMYLGMLLVILGSACYLASIWSALGVLFFFAFIVRFQIIPEERAMRNLFFEEFEEYCRNTRRWL